MPSFVGVVGHHVLPDGITSRMTKQQRLMVLAGGEMVEAAAPARAGQPERLLPTAVCKCAPDDVAPCRPSDSIDRRTHCRSWYMFQDSEGSLIGPKPQQHQGMMSTLLLW